MAIQSAEQKFRRLLEKHNEYDPEAYNFIYEVLDYTKNEKAKEGTIHVTAHELLKGFLFYTIEQFGCLAQTVLNEWGVKTTNDIGEIVYNLIEYDLMGKQPSDRKEEFNNFYNLKEVFNLKPIPIYQDKEKEWIVLYYPKKLIEPKGKA